ncbi:hypothetical protein Vretimale_16766 [Volvox reticuliferus]|nr:hypothetical protein Vretimale_16766 [Volvox reticuliferus]
MATCVVSANPRRRRANGSQLTPPVSEPVDGGVVADGTTVGITSIRYDTMHVATADNAAATAGRQLGAVPATGPDGKDLGSTRARSHQPVSYSQGDLGNCATGAGRTPRRTSSTLRTHVGHVHQPSQESNTGASSSGSSSSRIASTWVNSNVRAVASNVRSRNESSSTYPYTQDADRTGSRSRSGSSNETSNGSSIKGASLRNVERRKTSKANDSSRSRGSSSSGCAAHDLQVSRGPRRPHEDSEGRTGGLSKRPPPPPPPRPPPRPAAAAAAAVTLGAEPEVSERLDSWGPILALLQRRRQPGAESLFRTPSRLHAAVAPSPLLAVEILTSHPARAVAAAAHSLAANYPVIEAYSTGCAPAEAIVAAASTAAGAVAMVAAAASPVGSTAAGGIVGAGGGPDGTVTARRGGPSPRDAPPATATAGDDDGCHPIEIHGAVASGGSDGVLWPLMSEQLLKMAVRGSSSSSALGGACQGDDGSSREKTSDEDAVVLAAATAVLEEVASSILTHGIYPVRYGATKLRTSISTASKAAHVAASGYGGGGEGGGGSNIGGVERSAGAALAAATAARALEHMEELLMVPEVIRRAVLDSCKYHARHMTGAQVAAVLAALGSLALTLSPDGRGQLASRALKLLAVGFPEQQHQHQQHQHAVDENRPTLAAEGGTAAAAPAAAAAAVSQPLGQQRRLPPPLAALLMLLLVTVLPQELAHRQVRWLMWRQLRALLLPSWQQGHDGAGPLGVADVGSDEVESVDGTGHDGGGAAAAAAAGGGGGNGWKLPLVAVAALLVAGDRLQVLLHASDVEEAALQRLSRRADQLTPQQLLVIMRSLTSKQTMLGSDVLGRFVARLSTASAAGELHPREVAPLLGLLADQVHLLERRELSRLAEGIFRRVHRAARRRLDMAGPDADAAAPAAAVPGAGFSSGRTIVPRDPDLRDLAAICGDLEAVLGRLKLSWVDPDLLTAVRDELAGFAVSGGAHPEAALKAWQMLLRSPDYRRAGARASSASTDDFIEHARRELLRQVADDSERSSVLEAFMAVRPAGDSLPRAGAGFASEGA